MIKYSSEYKRKRLTAIMKLILLVIILTCIPAFLYIRFGAGVFSMDTVTQLTAFLRSHRTTAWLLIIFIQIIQVVICMLPGQPIQLASSYIFGIGVGFILSIIGAVIGTVISFYLAKLLGSDAMHIFFGKDKIKEYQRRLNSGRGLMLSFLIYLIPGFPKDIVSYAAGISDIRPRPFLLVATIGRSPGIMGSLLLGYFIEKQDYISIIIVLAAGAVILVICLIKRRSLIGILDRIEMKDVERTERSNG